MESGKEKMESGRLTEKRGLRRTIIENRKSKREASLRGFRPELRVFGGKTRWLKLRSAWRTGSEDHPCEGKKRHGSEDPPRPAELKVDAYGG